MRGKLRGRGRKGRFVAVASTCGDGVPDAGAGEECDGTQGCGDGEVCGSSCRCERGPQPLDCVVEGYPCRWAEVPPDVKARSLDLGRAAGAILGAGGTTAAAAEPILAAGPAVLHYDERFIRFRLAGGRPVWLSVPGAVGPVDDGPPPAEVVAAAAQLAARFEPRSVLAPGRLPKSAMILDPYAWQSTMSTAGPQAVAILADVEDYAGNITRLANTARGSTAVDVSTFAQLRGHNVVYVNSHGGRFCLDIRTQTKLPCYSFIKAGEIADADKAGSYDAVPGVDVWRERDGDPWTLAVSADFFRHHYPGGLDDALIVLDACDSYDSDLARALQGRNTNVAGWNSVTSWLTGGRMMAQFLGGLAQGRAITEVYTSMDTVQDARTGASLVIGRRDIRIRELVKVIDAFTGQPLVSGSAIEVTGYTDDEEPDSLLLITDLIGALVEEAASYWVEVSIDGRTYVHTTLDQFARYADEYRWHAEYEIDLGFAVHEQQPLDIKVTLKLPEGGTSEYAAVPLATNRRFSPGRKWRGTFTRNSGNGLFSTFIQVEAIFERDPTEEVTDLHPTFRQTSGTMSWQINDLGGDSCSHMAPPTVTELGRDDGNFIKFDLTEQPPQYYGSANTEGPFVDLTRSCPETDPVTSPTRAGGGWLTAPIDQNYAVTDKNTIIGIFNNGAKLPIIHQWNIQRVE